MKRQERKRSTPSVLTLALVCALVALYGCPREIADLREKIERLVEHLDSPAYSEDVAWEEHVVLCYRLAQDRDPTPVELAILEGVRLDPGIERSDVLALALGGAEERVSLAAWRRFLGNFRTSSFRPDASVKETAQRLKQTPGAEIRRVLDFTAEESRAAVENLTLGGHRHTASEPGVVYQTYFGFLHAHSHLSDGEGGALEAYTFARDQGGLDFFGLTDHGVSLFIRWPWEDKWKRLRDAAEATYDPGTYVTLWGFEWSNPVLGHVSILNTTRFTHTLARIRMPALYSWILEHPEAFARFNHPGRGGASVLGIEIRKFDHFELSPETVPQMVGLELWNKNEGFDRYYYSGSWNDNPTSFLDVGIQKGWQLGTLGGQDNHQKEWGTQNDFRTAVLAEKLTREALIEAYEKRRIYATEDKDLFLDFRASGYPMGSHVSGVQPRFEVTARDAGGDTFQNVRLYRDGVVIEERPVSGNEVSVTFVDSSPTGKLSHYYYVIVTQDDDGDGNGRNDEAISSPIWIDSSSG